MAGTSTKTKPVAARVPVELADWMETQGKAGDVIVQALTALRAGGVINSREAELEAKVASLDRGAGQVPEGGAVADAHG